MKYKAFLYIFLALIMTSCGQYEKLLKSEDYALKYTKALEYYESEDYVRAATLLEQVATVYRGTVKADSVFYYRSMSYFNQSDFIMAGHYFQELATTFPNSPFAEDASFLAGYCQYKLSPRPSLDQEYTYKAINTLSLFVLNYPNSERVDEAKKLISEMREKLVEKSYLNARLYFDLDDYKAAIVALRNSLSEYPNTNHREELMFMILKATYLLAENSVESKKLERYQATVDEYYSYAGEFPEGDHATEAESMYEESMAKLGQEIN